MRELISKLSPEVHWQVGVKSSPGISAKSQRSRKEAPKSEVDELNKREDEETRRPPTRDAEAENKVDSPPHQQTQHAASSNSAIEGTGASNQPRDSPDSDGGAPANTSHKGRTIGDFDDGANALWSLHEREARSHDEARIQSLKDDMDGVLIFAGLFSASLTSFAIDKIRALQVDPAQQTVYYLQQNVALLSQISQQLSSIAPQVSIPSTPPPPYPTFIPSSSDIKVNVYWFMSIIFSLSAALLATLVQQWVLYARFPALQSLAEELKAPPVFM